MTRKALTLPLLAFVLACLGLAFLKRAPGPQADASGAGADAAPAARDGDGKVVESSAGLAQLSVQSQPPGASLLINGRLAGSTPLALERLPVGDYGIRLEKEGCEPVTLKVVLGREGASLNQKLSALPTGSLVVDVKPDGSEVLLDGEFIGQTPLKLEKLAVGTYDLLIRKTNFYPYATRVEIQAGQPSKFAGIELTDRVLGMLEGLQKTEPQRLTHYIDMAHYFFVNNNLERAVDVFTQAMELMQTPLNFNGPGYPGKDKMSDVEIAQEERMRKKDEERLLKELDKHKNWPGKDVSTFRLKIEQANELITSKNLPSWEWAEHSARVYLNNNNYEKAARVYQDHIKVAPEGPDLPKAYLALMDLELMRRDLKTTREVFDTFFFMFSSNAEAMRNCGETFVNKHLERMVSSGDRTKLIDMAEKCLRRALEITYDKKAKAQCQSDLGVALLNTGRAADAVVQFQGALDQTDDVALREDRSLSLAGALRRAGKLTEARAVCEPLKDSPRPATVERVKIELLTIGNAERKK